MDVGIYMDGCSVQTFACMLKYLGSHVKIKIVGH